MKVKYVITEEFNSFEEEFSQYSDNPRLFSFCLTTTVCKFWEQGYLSSVLDKNTVENLEYGRCICVFASTGSGKTVAIKMIIQSLNDGEIVIILTNRKVCVTQLIKELFGENVSEELLDQIKSMIKVMTYQRFVHLRHQYQGKKITLICDECHCFAEDSVFSYYTKQIVKFLRNNRDNTKRIYMTATPDDVLPILWDIEAYDGQKFPLPEENIKNFRESRFIEEITCIEQIYMKKPDWDYLEFKFYDPDKVDTLIDYINQTCSDGQKALIYINNKERGAALQEKLISCQHIYSDEDKAAEIHEIAVNQSFPSDALVTTKVAENGLSLHDEHLTLIVAESSDPVTVQQIIGRARNPKHLTVLLPDYRTNHLGKTEHMLCEQLKQFQWVMNHPDFAMEKYCQTENPCIYYDAILKRPVVNDIGYFQIKRQLEYVQKLKQEESEIPHAHIRRILSLYQKSTDNIEEAFIDYDVKKECIDRITAAWEMYKTSHKYEDDLRTLKEALKSACNETGAYEKELKANIQIDTINKILKFAGITDTLEPKRRIFEITANNESSV